MKHDRPAESRVQIVRVTEFADSYRPLYWEAIRPTE
jgi:hypothetical protein